MSSEKWFWELEALLQELESRGATSQVQQKLPAKLAECKAKLGKVLEHKPKSEEARAKVKSGSVELEIDGEKQTIALDEEPDIRLALALSDELSLNELVCVDLLRLAQEEEQCMSTDMAAGIYFRERKDGLGVLQLLLRIAAHAGGIGGIPEQVAVELKLIETIEGLISGGLFQRLAQLAVDKTLLPSETSQLKQVLNERKCLESRLDLVMLERTRLWECLFHLSKRFGRALTRTKDALRTVVDAFTGTVAAATTAAPGMAVDDGARLAMNHHAVLCMLVLLALITAEPENEALAVAAGVEEAAKDLAITNALKNISPPGFYAVAQLALSLLAGAVPEKAADCEAHLNNARAGRAFFHLRGGVLESLLFQDDAPRQQELYTEVLLGALLRVLEPRYPGALVIRQMLRDAAGDDDDGDPFGQPVRPSPPLQPGQLRDEVADVLEFVAIALTYLPADKKVEILEGLGFGEVPGSSFGARDLFGQRAADECTAVPAVFVAMMRVFEAVAREDGVHALLTGARTTAVAGGGFGGSGYRTAVGAGRVADLLTRPLGRVGACWHWLFSILSQVLEKIQRHRMEIGPAVAPEDLIGLEAILDVLTATLKGLQLSNEGLRKVTRLSELCREMTKSDAPSLLQQLLNFPMPQLTKFRAAVLRCLTAFVTEPAAAYNLLQAFAEPNARLGMQQAPLLRAEHFQLTEAEARDGRYPESIAFLGLVNRMFELVLLPPPGNEDSLSWAASAIQAAALALPYTTHVREVILGQLGQRKYEDLRDKWRLAELGAYHLELSVEALLQATAVSGREALTGTVPAPGASVLLDLLGAGPAFRALFSLIEIGLPATMASRQNEAPGVFLEAALVATLRTLAKALNCDRSFVELYSRLQLQSVLGTAAAPDPARTLDRVLMAEPRRLATLLHLVRYPFHSDVQEYTIRIAGHLAARSPRLLEVLGAGSPTLDDLVDGFASALRDSIFTPRVRDSAALVSIDEDMDDEEAEAAEPMCDQDARAALILRLLLDTVGQPAPNLAHVLLGFGMEVGVPAGADGSRYFSCLDVVLEFLLAPNASTASSKPDLYEQCLELLYRLASQPATAGTTIGLLQERNCSLLIGLVQPLLGNGRPAPPPAHGDPSRTSCLRQRAWLVRVQALALLNGILLPEAAKVVRALLLPVRDEADTSEALTSAALGLVGLVEAPEEPSIDRSVSEASRALLQHMRLEGVLTGSLAPEEVRVLTESGVLVDSNRGYSLVDAVAFRRECLRRAEHIPGAPGSSQLESALQDALNFVEAFNAHVEALSAQELLVTALQELIEVTFARRLPLMLQQLREVAPSKTVEQLLSNVIRTLLYKAQALLKGPGLRARDVLAPPLCYAVAGIMGRLQATASTAVLPVALPDVPAGEGDLTPRLSPSDCAELLKLMVESVLAADRSERARLPLYLSVFSYLMYARPSKVSGEGLQAILEGRGKDPLAADGVARVDAVQNRLDEATSRVLTEHGAALTARMAQDAVEAQWPEMYRALCLRLMGTLVAMDPRGGFAKEVAQSALPRALLSSLGAQTTALLQQSPLEAQRSLSAVEAALGLLLDLVQCSPRDDAREMARRLYDMRALQYLTAIKALGVPPEDPGQAQGAPSPTLRERINRVLTPVLRLASLMVTLLSESDRVVSEAINFIETHSRPLVRILREVGESRGVVGWEQGEAELEQAQLILHIFSRLPSGESLSQRFPQLHYAALALAQEFMGKNAEAANRYLAALALAPDAGAHAVARGRGTAPSTSAPGALSANGVSAASAAAAPLSSRRGTTYERLAQRVLALRCALLQFMRQAVLADRLRLPCATDLKSPDAYPSLVQVLGMIEQTVTDLDLGLKDRSALVSDLKSKDDERLQTVLTNNGVAKETVQRLGVDSRRRLAERIMGRLERHTARAARQHLYLLENALAVLHFHIDRAVRSAGQQAAASGLPLAGGQSSAHLMANAAAVLATDPTSLEMLRKRTLAVMNKLQQTTQRHQAAGEGLGDVRPEDLFQSVEGLTRRVKDSLTVLVGGFGL